MTAFYAKNSQNGLKLFSKDDKLLQELPVVQATEEHRSYILSTWVRSYEAHARKLRLSGLQMQQDVYRGGESKVAEDHWNKAHVLGSEADSYVIHAWVCGEPGKLYHVYVPPHLRQSHIATELVERVCGTFYTTHKPWPHKAPSSHHVTWSPYL